MGINLKKLAQPGMHLSSSSDCGEMLFGTELLRVFINSDTGQLDVTIDALGDDALFDLNLEWESCNKEGEPVTDESWKVARETIARFLKKSAERQGFGKVNNRMQQF